MHLTQLVHVMNLSLLSTQRILTRAFLSETFVSEISTCCLQFVWRGLCHHIIEDPETCFRVFAFWIQNPLWKSRVGTVKISYFVQWCFYLGERTQSGSIPFSFCPGLDQFKLGCTNQFHGSSKRQKKKKSANIMERGYYYYLGSR